MEGCATDEYTVECGGGGLTPTPVCNKCDDNQNLKRPDGSTYVAKEGTRCHSKCDPGSFKTRNSDGDDACFTARSDMCAVGSYLKPSGMYSDAECMPCTTATPSDTNRVFVTHGGNEDKCEEQCTTGNFLPSPEYTCSDCNPSRCNRENQFLFNGVTQCTHNQSAQCVPCIDPLATSSGIRFIGPGEDTCMYECAAGKHGLPQCGEWDLQTEDTVVLFNISEISVTSVEGQDTIGSLYTQGFQTSPGVDTVLRMRGHVKLSAERDISAAVIWFSPPGSGLDVSLQKYTPRLSVQNNEAVFELISLDWRMIHTDTSLPFLSVYIKPTATTAIIKGLSLEIQQRGQCSDKAYSCIDCDASSLPANANYIRSRNCDWECNFEHERREDNTCMFCPYKLCDVGKYMADCGQCSACVKSDNLTIFISPGTTRGLNSSCATTCPAGHFSDPMEQVCTKCKSDITCPLDMYRKPCTAIHDMHCMGCGVCAVGSYETSPCNTTTDVVCTQCKSNRSATGDLPAHATWTAATYTSDGKQECRWECNHGYVEDEIHQVCKICTHECGSGEYSTECTMHTGWEGCSQCVKPPNSTFTGVGRDKPMSCPWECNDGLELRDYQCVEVFGDTLPPAPVVSLCLLELGDCEPGHHPATSSDNGSEEGVQGSVSKSLCFCKKCTPPPNASIAQFIQRGNCEWVCSYPYIRSNGMCVRLLDITRMTRELSSTSPGTFINVHPSKVEPDGHSGGNNVTHGMYIEPVTGWHVAGGGGGESIKSTVILSVMIPFFVVLVVAVTMMLRM
jgi:hypothetical protein